MRGTPHFRVVRLDDRRRAEYRSYAIFRDNGGIGFGAYWRDANEDGEPVYDPDLPLTEMYWRKVGICFLTPYEAERLREALTKKRRR